MHIVTVCMITLPKLTCNKDWISDATVEARSFATCEAQRHRVMVQSMLSM